MRAGHEADQCRDLIDPACPPDNIRVVTVTPGAIETPSLVDAVRQNAKDMIPLGRVGGADEFARVVVYIASDDASYISGAEIMVDGAMIC